MTVPDGLVRRIWLGTVSFGRWGNPDPADCVRIVDAASERGIDAIDTAQLYSDGQSEEIVGRAIAGRREQFVVATKFGHKDQAYGRTSSAAAAVDTSLRRLGTDYVDLFQLHRLPHASDLGPLLESMSALVDAGKARAIGASGLRPSEMLEAHAICRERGLHPLSTEQAPYSIFVREIEREVLPTCRRLGVALLGFAPLNGSFLTRKYVTTAGPPSESRAARWPLGGVRFDFSRPELLAKVRLADELSRIAALAGMSLVELAMRWALSNDEVAGIVVGARAPAQVTQTIPADPSGLPPDILHAVDRVVAPGRTIDPEDLALYRRAHTRDAQEAADTR